MFWRSIFPFYRPIGGASLHVALSLATLGLEAPIISRIGNDALGKELFAFIQASHVSTETIQTERR